MSTPDTAERTHSAPAHGQQLSAATATPRQRGVGIALMLTSSVSNQTGAALGAMAFPAIGPVGVVAVRQIATALILAPIVRPSYAGCTRTSGCPSSVWRSCSA